MVAFPASQNELTADWLTRQLADAGASEPGCAVTSVHSSLHPSQGAFSQVFQIELDWSCLAVHGEPTRLIAKLPSAFASVRDFAAASSLYRNEVRWYREFGADPGIPVPRVHAAEAGETPEQFFILMEDMSPSQPGGARPPFELVERGVDVLARFHAKWWQSDVVLNNDWLPGVDLERDADWIAENEIALSNAANENRVRYAERYNDYVYRSAVQAATSLRLIRERSQTRPRTLLHGDFTTRQFFVPTATGGRFAVSDWQTTCSGPGAEDFARHISIQLDPEILGANEERLVRRYHDGLLAGGVQNYALDDLWEDIRWGLWRTLWIQTRGFAAMDDSQIEKIRTAAAVAGRPDPQAENAARLGSCLKDHDFLGLFD